MLDPNNHAYEFNIQCDNGTPMCRSGNFWAHMSDTNSRMNFCDKFFIPYPDGTLDQILTTEQRLSEGIGSVFDLRRCPALTLWRHHT